MRNCCPYREAEFQRRLIEPAAISGLQFCYDAADLRTLGFSGSNITTWACAAKRGPTINAGGTGPTWDRSAKAAVFDGASHWRRSTDLFTLASTDFTWFTLLRTNASQQSINAPIDIEHAIGPNGPLVFQNETNRPAVNNFYFAWYNGSAFSNTGAPFVVVAANTWSVLRMRKRGSSVDAVVNGLRGSGWPRTDVSSFVINAKTITLGGNSGGSRLWGGSLAATLLYSRGLSDAECEVVEGSLVWARVMAGQLDARHRFRNRPPLIGD